MRLYTQIFSFLSKFMAWYTERSMTRFLKSFNEDIYCQFQDSLAQIKCTSGLLSQQLQLHMSGDVAITRLSLENTNADVKYLIKTYEDGMEQLKLRDAALEDSLQRMMRFQFENTEKFGERLEGMMQDYNERLRRHISGVSMTNLLEEQASREFITTSRLLGPPSPNGEFQCQSFFVIILKS